MNERFEAARGIANAILYEGYLLYPYTASAQKNQMRWQFGVVVPKAYEAMGTGERADQYTDVLIEAAGAVRIDGLTRFLHVEVRSVEAYEGGAFTPVAALDVDGTRYLSFDGAVEREIPFTILPEQGPSTTVAIALAPTRVDQELRDPAGRLAGRIVRTTHALEGTIVAGVAPLEGAPGLHRLNVTLENHSDAIAGGERGAALRTAFISAHTLLAIEGGAFLSPVDPPDVAVAATESLANRRTWPVLMGEGTVDPQRSPLVLSSPIILGDFPAISAKTDTDHFDATEIDELLTLSVLSLSDAERAEARATDPRARAIVDRAEAYGAAGVLDVHDGALDVVRDDALDARENVLFPDPRNRRLIEPKIPTAGDLERLAAGELDPYEQLPPATLEIGGVAIEKGSTVRLAPKRRADAWDTFLDGKLATVRAIHQDFEDKIYVAVTVDDDPASDLHQWYGRSFFFEPDEVEPCRPDPPVRA